MVSTCSLKSYEENVPGAAKAPESCTLRDIGWGKQFVETIEVIAIYSTLVSREGNYPLHMSTLCLCLVCIALLSVHEHFSSVKGDTYCLTVDMKRSTNVALEQKAAARNLGVAKVLFNARPLHYYNEILNVDWDRGRRPSGCQDRSPHENASGYHVKLQDMKHECRAGLVV